MTYDSSQVAVNQPEATREYKDVSVMGKLNDLYKMRIHLCDKEGNSLGENQVVAVAIDAEMTVENQYSTPFEASNLAQTLPTLVGMLQAGDWVNTFDSVMSSLFGIQLSGDKKESLNQLQGRSSLTKQNSTQIFVASQPVTISATIYFGAWENAKTEVEDQIRLLQQWASPVELIEGLLTEVAENMSLKSLFPSTAPPFVAVYYGGKKIMPLLIQSVSAPMVVPMDSKGNRMQLQVQITFVSRTSWDANNITQMYGG